MLHGWPFSSSAYVVSRANDRALRFGLAGPRENLASVGSIFGVTRTRVAEIQRRELYKLWYALRPFQDGPVQDAECLLRPNDPKHSQRWKHGNEEGSAECSASAAVATVSAGGA